MRLFLPLFVVSACTVLAGCDSPSPGFGRGERVAVSAGGFDYSIYRVGARVQVIRTSRNWRPSGSAVRAGAALAIMRATGCAVKEGSLEGDHAIMQAKLDC